MGQKGQLEGRTRQSRMSILTLKARMRMIPGMEAMRMSHRHPMVGMTTEARPMISREPASQKTWGERWKMRIPHKCA